VTGGLRQEMQWRSLYKHTVCFIFSLWQYRIILSADTASEVRQMPSQKRR